MPPIYILPCTNCDYRFELGAKQAGLELACPQCSQVLEAPMLGKMRQLEVVGGTEIAKSATTSGRGPKNFLFVAGLALAIIGAASGFGISKYADSLDPRYERDSLLEYSEDIIEKMTPSEVVDHYIELNVDAGLGEWFEPNYVRYGKQTRYIRMLIPIFYGLAGLGLLALIGSFLMKK